MIKLDAAAPLPPLLVVLLLVLVVICALLSVRRQAHAGAAIYLPQAAWLRALAYFGLCLIVANYSGVLATVLNSPLASQAQLADPWWLALTGACLAVIVIGYALIWPLGTFNDGRKAHPVLSLLYGVVWGSCQGLLFLSFWAAAQSSGLGVWWVALISYILIGAYNGCLHNFYWDKYVSPPHNYSEWNTRKVLLCHTPNLLICLPYLALYGNVGIYVLLQGLALAISAFVMRFPAWWDDYAAEAGAERSIAELSLIHI